MQRSPTLRFAALIAHEYIGDAPKEDVPKGYREETFLSHMTRAATKAWPHEAAE